MSIQVYAPIRYHHVTTFTTQAENITNTRSVMLRSFTVRGGKLEWETSVIPVVRIITDHKCK